MMYKVLIKNNYLYITLKILISVLLMLLIFMQNYFVFMKIDQFGILQSFERENEIQYILYANNPGLIPMDMYEGYNEIWHKLKETEGINVDYRYFQQPTSAKTKSFLMLDKDYYIREYDGNFKSDIYPCVLRPTTVKNMKSYEGMPVVGDTSKYIARDYGTFESYDPSTDMIILIDDIYIFDKDIGPYFMIFTQFIGGNINVSVINEEDADIALEVADKKVNEVVEWLIDEFKKIDTDISFFVSSTQKTINNIDDVIFNELDVNRTRNIAYVLMFFAAFITMMTYFIFKNTEYVSLSLFLGRSKLKIGYELLALNIGIDIISSIIFFISYPYLCPDIEITNPYLLTSILFTGTLIMDLIVVLIIVLRINRDKMLLWLRSKEAD